MVTPMRTAWATAAGRWEASPARRLRPSRPLALVVAAHLAVSIALHHRLVTQLTTTTAGSTSSDSYQFIWWIRWLPWALAHGEDLLYTTYLYAPQGVNGMWNTPAPVLAVLFAPVTLTAGPVAAYNVAMILGPVASGVALVLALGAWVDRWWPRAAAGLLYGFSPFVLAHTSAGHMNLVWAVLPPALLWLLHALLVARREPRRVGLLVGIAFAVQTGIYTQTVALCAVVLVATALVLAVRWPAEAVRRTLDVRQAVGACAATYVVLCAYPLYLLLAGPGRPHAEIRAPETSNSDAANLLVPTRLTAVRAGTGELAERLHTHVGEQGGYVGIALLVVLGAAVLTGRSLTRVVAAVGAAAWVLSLGVSLVVLGHDTGVALPWRPMESVPLVGEIETMRFQMIVALCAAVVVALWLDALADRPPGAGRSLAFAATGVALLTWLPADEQVATPAEIPRYFAAGAPGLSRADVVVTHPRTSSAWGGGARPMLWQVASGFAYRSAGGYFIGSDAEHDLLYEALPIAYEQGAIDAAAGDTPSADPDVARTELRARGVTAVVVVPEGGDDAAVLAWTRRVTGLPGEQVADVWLFRLVVG